MHTATLPSPHVDEGLDFARLFPASQHGAHLTARTARLLHDVLRYLGEVGHTRLAQLGDRPVREQDEDLFTALPAFTWHQSVHWRRRFIAVFDEIADQLAQGRAPMPGTPAEEFALWLAIVQAELLITMQPDVVEHAVGALAPEAGDFDWPQCHARLFRHAYVPLLFLEEFAGMQDPGHDANRRLRIGDYRPAGWFREFTAAAAATATAQAYPAMRWV